MTKAFGLGDEVFRERTWGWQTAPTLGVPGKKRYAMVIDLRKCTGCEACVLACKSEFDVPLSVSRIWLKVVEIGHYPNFRRVVVPRLCNQCDNPICVRNCPTSATFKHQDGFVLQRYNQCIGCRTCMIACPYNARHLLPGRRTDMNKPTHVVDKCDFCIHRVTRGLLPACVAACPTRAMMFGDINDENSKVHELAEKRSLKVLKPDMGTLPQVYYIGPMDKSLDAVDSFLNRSAQHRDDFNEFKYYSEPSFGDIAEGESATKWIFKNMWGQISDAPHKLARMIMDYTKVLFRSL